MKRKLIVAVVLVGVVGVGYLAAVGSCQVMFKRGQLVSLTQGLGLTPAQQSQVDDLQKEFLAQKKQSCELLCAKRAQLIQLLKEPSADRGALYTLVEEIGREQTALEKGTVEHLLAVRSKLEPEQRKRLTARVTDQLRLACQATACGSTPGCLVTDKKGN